MEIESNSALESKNLELFEKKNIPMKEKLKKDVQFEMGSTNEKRNNSNQDE